jgi:hypothetical protein
MTLSTELSPQLATACLGVGLVFSLVCYLTTNLSPGGMITPGWIALTLVEDYRHVAVIAVMTALTFGLIQLLNKVVILYGKRLFAAVVLPAGSFSCGTARSAIAVRPSDIGVRRPGSDRLPTDPPADPAHPAGHQRRCPRDLRGDGERDPRRARPFDLKEGIAVIRQSSPFSRRRLLIAGATTLAGVAALSGGCGYQRKIDDPALPAAAPQPSAAGPSFARLMGPPRTEMRDAMGNVVALFTDGARTVRLEGTQRTFEEPRYTKAKVLTTARIRLAPQPWKEGAQNEAWFQPWLDQAMASTEPDALEVAFQYIYGAKVIKNAEGVQVAGDAAFGPLSTSDADGRAEASDFYDYLGVPWNFTDGVREKPSPDRLRSLDCSGYLRMIFGYRLGFPLSGSNTGGGGLLPRRAYAIADVGPGVQLIPNTGRRVSDLSALQPGDLLFFHGAPEIAGDGPNRSTHIEHSGLYLGVDDRGHHRFISSRTSSNGPTMGDAGGESILDGTGHFATSLRTARRI